MDVGNTINARQHTHGDFKLNAGASQALKRMVKHHTCVDLTSVQQEALDNICQKMARIITGNPNHADNWHDIAGYATQAERRCPNDNC
jgi:hypothetical protein